MSVWLPLLLQGGLGYLQGQQQRRQAEAQNIIDANTAKWSGFTGKSPSKVASAPTGLESLISGFGGGLITATGSEEGRKELSQWWDKLGKKSDTEEALEGFKQLESGDEKQKAKVSKYDLLKSLA